MPARVVIVHDDPNILDPLAEALMVAGLGVAKFGDAQAAWDALGEARSVEVLITRIRFARGKPHGLGLVIHTRKKRPDVKVIFTGSPRANQATQSMGSFIATPLDLPNAVATVQRVLA